MCHSWAGGGRNGTRHFIRDLNYWAEKTRRDKLGKGYCLEGEKEQQTLY
jgi:hypothetical protein